MPDYQSDTYTGAAGDQPHNLRALRGRLGAHISWANTRDPAARTAPARRAFDARFEREVDPDGTLPDEERIRRAAAARKAYFVRLSLRSASARSRAAGDAGADDR